MKIYILVAKGSMSLMSGQHTVLCKTAFRSYEAAQQHVPDFRARAVEDCGKLFTLDPNNTRVSISEIELAEFSEEI